MTFDIVDLNEKQSEIIDSKLEEYDEKHITYKLTGSVSIGIKQNGDLIAGASGCITAFRIFYISTVFVDENYRGKGLGRKLIEAVEEKAKYLGANLIRLDTFNWQGAEFYLKLGYEQVGCYMSKEDDFSEHFFIKRL